MLEGYKDVITLEEFSDIIRKGKRSAVKILLSESAIKYRVLRGSYRISKESVIKWLEGGENDD